MYTKHMTATKFYFPWGETMLKISNLTPRPRVEQNDIVSFESVNRFNSLASICECCNYSNCECSTSKISSNILFSNNTSASSNKSAEQRSDYDNEANSSQTIYNLSSLIDNDLAYDNTTIENNTYENDVHENEMHVNDNVHEDQSSMSAQSMLNLGLSRKGFKMGHLNIQGIQNKIDQIDLLVNSSQNNIRGAIDKFAELLYYLNLK